MDKFPGHFGMTTLVPKTTYTPIQVQQHKDNQKYTCIQVLHLNVRSLKKHFGKLET